MLSITAPKVTRPTLDVINDMFVVQNGLFYDYYPVKVSPHPQGLFLPIEISPPVVKDGYICFQRKIYRVSVRDLLKGRINVRNEEKPAETAGEKRGKNKSATRGNSVQNSSTQRVDEFVEYEKPEDINLAFENQIDSLLHHLHTEEGEEWEIQDHSQS